MARTRKPERAAPTLPESIANTLSTSEVARLCGVTSDTVRVWVIHGKLRAYNVGSEKSPRYRIPRLEIERLFKEPDTVPQN